MEKSTGVEDSKGHTLKASNKIYSLCVDSEHTTLCAGLDGGGIDIFYRKNIEENFVLS